MHGLLGIPAAILLGSVASAQSVQTPDYKFTYTYPPAAARIVPLRAWFDSESAHLRAKLVRDASVGRAAATRSRASFAPYEDSVVWKEVTSTPRLLSLSGEHYSFSGGAHGQSPSLSLIWDKKAHRRLDGATVFASPAAAQSALGASWCAWLKVARQRRTGTGSDPGECPLIKGLTLLLGSSDRLHINRIGLIADPYVAGSYAEGTYETTLPVTAAVLQSVKPAYRSAFAPS